MENEHARDTAFTNSIFFLCLLAFMTQTGHRNDIHAGDQQTGKLGVVEYDVHTAREKDIPPFTKKTVLVSGELVNTSSKIVPAQDFTIYLYAVGGRLLDSSNACRQAQTG